MINKLPMRLGVGIVLLNKDNEVFVGKRKDNPIDKWQMPQGGIDNNEKPLDAMKRELKEETSIINIKILKEINNWREYELPPHLLVKIWRGKYRGQTQKWFAFRFNGDETDINVGTENPEFSEWKWSDHNLLVENIVPFKREVYEKVLDEFKDLFN